MENLIVANGNKKFTLNGGQILEFNPTDPIMLKRLYDVIHLMDEKQVKYESSGDDVRDVIKFLEEVEKLDKEMHDAIDEVFGVHIDFGGVCLYAYADGLPVWANFIFAVIDKMEVSMADNRAARNPRLQALMDKYKKK